MGVNLDSFKDTSKNLLRDQIAALGGANAKLASARDGFSRCPQVVLFLILVTVILLQLIGWQ
ncbi:MAG: hypothetical protein B7X35_06185 [Halothiobacillus sp. 14-56-357]|jgi:hypothetical protein|nr:MAG: hypothetical protein B7X44_03135 [Halothiobacillus sp. 15-55-196]OZB56297.1 MAG: hypothetical protein B7X35_06185 [Halothiobacillus sp. 14-56-357]OZB78799.1 MAG: hypothetical protein B7X29_03410 [Halothiobacillus sp. 13-55-115]